MESSHKQDLIQNLGVVVKSAQQTDERGLDAWFLNEVVPLEGKLVHFLRKKWHDKAEIPDLVQEVFLRIYQAALREKPEFVQAFAFQTARNLIIDRLRQRNIVSIESVADFDESDVLSEEPGPERIVAARQELQLLQRALDRLPRRCREVVVQRKVYGYSQREVAERMGTAEATVEAQLMKGLRLLAQSVNWVEGPLLKRMKRL